MTDDLVAHTRGPWCVEAAMSNRALDIALDYQIQDAGNPLLIASAYSDEGEIPTLPGYISPAEAEANARVMAAAPVLLALVKRYASECAECHGRGYSYGDDGITGCGPNDVEPTRCECHECADIREIIAKAEGRSNG